MASESLMLERETTVSQLVKKKQTRERHWTTLASLSGRNKSSSRRIMPKSNKKGAVGIESARGSVTCDARKSLFDVARSMQS